MESLALPLSLCHEMTAARRKKKAMGEIPPMAFDYDLRLKKENLQAPGSLGNQPKRPKIMRMLIRMPAKISFIS